MRSLKYVFLLGTIGGVIGALIALLTLGTPLTTFSWLWIGLWAFLTLISWVDHWVFEYTHRCNCDCGSEDKKE